MRCWGKAGLFEAPESDGAREDESAERAGGVGEGGHDTEGVVTDEKGHRDAGSDDDIEGEGDTDARNGVIAAPVQDEVDIAADTDSRGRQIAQNLTSRLARTWSVIPVVLL